MRVSICREENLLMKLVRFLHHDQIKCGCLEGDQIKTVTDFITLKKTDDGVSIRLDEVRLLAPAEPSQVVAIGLNYVDHAKEQNKALPEEPMMFMVSPSAIAGPEEDIYLQNSVHRIDFEAELVIMIGKKAHKVKARDAAEYILGYTCGNDISDRDYQKKDGQFTRAKSFPGYKAIGPWIETELSAQAVSIKLSVNGELKQDGNTGQMIHSIDKIIESVTEVMTLNPGDLIFTGTPAGVGALKREDKVEITIEGLGTLRNYIK
jgi:2-keto-4-pentenoate hydratase/2-oxohepta-3-ene-1,7-dioic acid hydratase in catechol pathway